MRRSAFSALVPGLAFIVLVAGCNQVLGLTAPELGGAHDASVDDVPTDGAPLVDTPLCYGTFETICFSAPPSGSLTISTDINTADSNLCMSATPSDVCAIGARSIVIDAMVTVVGGRPLVLVGADTLTISASGVLDGGSTRIGPRLGPGVGRTDVVCSAGTPPASGTAGGAGGTLAGSGGSGGDGTSTGGVPGGLPVIQGLHPGCPGQKGTGPNNGVNAGLGGNGGGAIYLLGETVAVAGRVTVGGAGGGAGNFSAQGASGGGGGGSGGMIVIETAHLQIMGGALLANGGGGGEGSTVSSGGMFGADAQSTAAAPGGAVLTNGGDGGDGSYGQQLAGATAGTGTSGGGGGGGAGIVNVITSSFMNSGGMISPPST
jgi:hypothetical protein